jgi:hypothetical protein
MDLSFETFDPVYHALERLDSFLRVLRGRLSMFCKVVRGSLYGSEFPLYVLLSGAKYLAVVLVGNLTSDMNTRTQSTDMTSQP